MNSCFLLKGNNAVSYTHLDVYKRQVYGYDPYLSVNAAWNVDKAVKHVIAVEDIYRECDYITIHVPLMDATRGMVSKDAIAMMKDGVVFLNFSRDTLVDEDAMVELSLIHI